MEETFTAEQGVFSYIRAEENAYQIPVKISDGYSWSMPRHIKLSTLYPLSQYENAGGERPFKQIIQPILNMQYRSEGFDVKDILLFVNDKKNNHKSFLVKKYYEKYVREHDLDTVIDDSIESYVDMGGTLIKMVDGKLPESVPLNRIAFCDQTDILSGPLCEKLSLSPDQLKDMESLGWGSEKNGATITIDELISISNSYKIVDPQNSPTATPGKYIEIYELHGTLPDRWLDKEGYEGKENKFTRQLQIVSFYNNPDREKQWVCLYKGKESKQIYDIEKRVKKIYGRALGMGGAEELFESQIGVNFDTITKREMLEAASKVLLYTTDKQFAKRQNLKDADNLSLYHLEDGKVLGQVNTTPVNIRLFDESIREWEDSARSIGAANESIMGEQPNSGTPFKLQELVTAESHSFHEYKKGKLAKFWEKIHRNSIIPNLVKEINKGSEFLATLDLNEMQEIVDRFVTNKVNDVLKERVLSGEAIQEGEKEVMKEKMRTDFMGSNKKFLNLVKDELKDIAVDIEINIVGKQKNLAQTTDKLVNVFKQMASTYNPQTGTFAIFDDPRMSKIFDNIIEYSGLSPMDFFAPSKPQAPQATPQGNPAQLNTAPLEQLSTLNKG